VSQKLGGALLVSRTNINWGKNLVVNCLVREIALISFSCDFMGRYVICLDFCLVDKGVQKLGVATTNINLFTLLQLFIRFYTG